MTSPRLMSKADFARLCNTSKARVSQWLKEGKIGKDALVGEGRSARINADVAWERLARELDPDQMLSNGAGTNIPKRSKAAPAADRAATEGPADHDPDLDFAHERARLTKAQADTAEFKHGILVGSYLNADEAVEAWSIEIVAMRQRMLATITDIAQELPHLSKHDVSVIDRVIRDAMIRAGQSPVIISQPPVDADDAPAPEKKEPPCPAPAKKRRSTKRTPSKK